MRAAKTNDNKFSGAREAALVLNGGLKAKLGSEVIKDFFHY